MLMVTACFAATAVGYAVGYLSGLGRYRRAIQRTWENAYRRGKHDRDLELNPFQDAGPLKDDTFALPGDDPGHPGAMGVPGDRQSFTPFERYVITKAELEAPGQRSIVIPTEHADGTVAQQAFCAKCGRIVCHPSCRGGLSVWGNG